MVDLPAILRFNRFSEAIFSCVFPDLFQPIVRFCLTTLIPYTKLLNYIILLGFAILVYFLSF